MNCPHLLSNEMTDQVNSGASDPILSSPLVVCIQLLSPFCSAEPLSFSGRMGCDAVFALPATLGTPTALHSVPIDDVSLSVSKRLSLYIRMLVPRSTLACPNWFTHPATIPTIHRHGDIRVVRNTCLELIARVIHNHAHHISLATAFTL